MNRVEFMRQLESLLQNVSPTERNEALQYYNDYFDDAGTENEQSVIEALGNPARVAENIRKDLLESGYGENFVQRRAQASDRELIEYDRAASQQSFQEPVKYADKPEPSGGKKLAAWEVALIVILILFGSPVCVGVIGTLFGVLASYFAVVLSFGVCAVALFIVMVSLIAVGFMAVAVDPISGMALVGGGLVCGALGILFLMLTVALAGIVTPAIFRGISFLFRKLFQKIR